MMSLVRVVVPLDRVRADPAGRERLILRCRVKIIRATSRRLLRVVVAALVLAGCPTGPARGLASSTKEQVGQVGTNRYYTPANQILTPAGRQVELPGMRPQALALSPGARLLVTAGKT